MLAMVPKNHPNHRKGKGALDSVDDRETPPDVFDPLNAEFHFTLDVAAARHNAKCRRYYTLGPGPLYLARQLSVFPEEFVGDADALGIDGLAQEWGGHEVVWANPPFSDLEPWVRKASECDATVVMLLPNNRTEQPFFQELIEPYRDRPGSILTTRNLPKRRTFLHHGKAIVNRTSKSPPFGVTIVIWDRRELNRCRRVPLSQGLAAIVDEGDAGEIAQHRWFAGKRKNTFYGVRHNPSPTGPRLIYMHRTILVTAGKVDHINGDGLDNRRCNLRAASDAENARNMRKAVNRNCSSRFKGVSRKKRAGCWVANICVDYKKVHLGYFKSEEDAARAYDAAAVSLFGAFARTNFTQDRSGNHEPANDT